MKYIFNCEVPFFFLNLKAVIFNRKNGSYEPYWGTQNDVVLFW
jgi:hypothetical protein